MSNNEEMERSINEKLRVIIPGYAGCQVEYELMEHSKVIISIQGEDDVEIEFNIREHSTDARSDREVDITTSLGDFNENDVPILPVNRWLDGDTVALMKILAKITLPETAEVLNFDDYGLPRNANGQLLPEQDDTIYNTPVMTQSVYDKLNEWLLTIPGKMWDDLEVTYRVTNTFEHSTVVLYKDRKEDAELVFRSRRDCNFFADYTLEDGAYIEEPYISFADAIARASLPFYAFRLSTIGRSRNRRIAPTEGLRTEYATTN